MFGEANGIGFMDGRCPDAFVGSCNVHETLRMPAVETLPNTATRSAQRPSSSANNSIERWPANSEIRMDCEGRSRTSVEFRHAPGARCLRSEDGPRIHQASGRKPGEKWNVFVGIFERGGVFWQTASKPSRQLKPDSSKLTTRAGSTADSAQRVAVQFGRRYAANVLPQFARSHAV